MGRRTIVQPESLKTQGEGRLAPPSPAFQAWILPDLGPA